MTLAIFRNEGNCPVEKDIIVEKCHFKIFTEMLFGADDLGESREDL